MCFHQSLCSMRNAFFFANFGFYGRPISISDFYGWCGFVNFGFYRVILWGQFLSSPCEAVWPIWGSLCDTLLGLMGDVFPPVLDSICSAFPPIFFILLANNFRPIWGSVCDTTLSIFHFYGRCIFISFCVLWVINFCWFWGWMVVNFCRFEVLWTVYFCQFLLPHCQQFWLLWHKDFKAI